MKKMLFNILDNKKKRTISTCNYNQHICTVHPDRVMEEHDLIYIREGSWNISQDGIDYALNPGDVILLQGGHHHYGIISCENTVKTCFVHFNRAHGDAVREYCDNGSDFYGFPMVVHCKTRPVVEMYFNKIIYAYWSEDTYAKQKAEAWLELCLCELCSLEKPNGKNMSLAEDIKLQIKMTPERFISNKEFADKYCCSIRTLTSKFKECTGYSLHAWQIMIKCRMAKELMECDSSLTLKEIAAIYGFYDEYHFSKCYKKIFGSSPAKNRGKYQI